MFVYSCPEYEVQAKLLMLRKKAGTLRANVGITVRDLAC